MMALEHPRPGGRVANEYKGGKTEKKQSQENRAAKKQKKSTTIPSAP
jgi:hypothetical protein